MIWCCTRSSVPPSSVLWNRCPGSELSLGQRGPPVVHARHRRRMPSVELDAANTADAEEERRDPSSPLHPAHPGRQQWLLGVVLDEPPPGVAALAHRSLDQGVGQPPGELEVLVVASPLPRVEER